MTTTREEFLAHEAAAIRLRTDLSDKEQYLLYQAAEMDYDAQATPSASQQDLTPFIRAFRKELRSAEFHADVESRGVRVASARAVSTFQSTQTLPQSSRARKQLTKCLTSVAERAGRDRLRKVRKQVAAHGRGE